MPHSWADYDLAKKIVDALKEAELLKSLSDLQEKKARGIIQIMLEERKNENRY